MISVFIGLGSNLNEPRVQLQQALQELALLPLTQLVKVSCFYRSDAWGPVQAQPEFVNAVAELHTDLTPRELLTQLKCIEQQQGRDPHGLRWGPRSIDLDILLYGQIVLTEEDLTIPHPQLGERDFVIYPLLELAPDLVLPSGIKVQQLSENCPSTLRPMSELCYEK